jgi:hypothetical protein
MKTQLRLACLSLLAVICLALTAVPAWAQNDLYDNGPVNGEVDGWQINNGNGVSDSFSCQSSPGLAPEAACKGTHIKEVSFYAWLEPGDTATGVEIAIGSAGYFSNNLFDGTVSLTQSHCFTNGLGFDVCQESGNFSGPALNAGNYLPDIGERNHGRRRSALLGREQRRGLHVPRLSFASPRERSRHHPFGDVHAGGHSGRIDSRTQHHGSDWLRFCGISGFSSLQKSRLVSAIAKAVQANARFHVHPTAGKV